MQKVKKLWQNKFLRNYTIINLTLFLMEVIFRLISGLNIFSYSFLRVIIGLNIFSLIWSLIVSLLPNLGGKILNIILLSVFSIYSIAELGFKSFLGVYASLSISSQAGAVMSYAWDFIRSFAWYYYLIFIPLILVLVYYFVFDKKIVLDLPKRKKNVKFYLLKLIPLTVIILLMGLYYSTLKIPFMQNTTQNISTYNLFKKPSNPSLVVNNFGIVGFGFLDVREYFFPGKEIDNYTVDYNPNQIDEEEEEDEHILIDNDIWKEIIDNEKNTNYNTLNKYFISNDTSYTNKYTGLFEGKNLILIMVESGSNLLINEDLYPNFTKLYNEGWTWQNYYSPRNSCSTGNNEMSGMTSLYTIYNNCTANVYKNNVYFESIFNLFNNKGYNTNSFHDHIDAYYYRTTIHKNMGSQKFYKVQNMKIPYGHEYGDWASDEDMMKFYLQTLDERTDTTPFMSWITTVTSHMPYSNSSMYNDKYYDLMPEEYSKDVRRYMSKLKVVDNALGILIDGLKERDLLKDTVIVLYADHYPYAISNANLTKAYGYEVNIDNNVEQVPFVIYNPELKSKKYKEYTSYVNITPTLANLFNLDYDSRLYLGDDILDDDYEEMVLFADGSWKNSYGFYNNSSNNINYYTNKTYTDEELLAINEKNSLKLKMSSLAIKTNYFKYLDKKLNSYKEEGEEKENE